MNGHKRICAIDFQGSLSPTIVKYIQAKFDLIVDIVNCEPDTKKYLSINEPTLILFFVPRLNYDINAILTQVGLRCGTPTVLYILDPANCEEIISLLKLGLDDFIVQPIGKADLVARICGLLEPSQLEELHATKSFLKHKYGLTRLLGESPSFLRAVDRMVAMAKFEAVILLLGETGTGKELFARAIHFLGSRSNKPFIPVNCGAIPVELFENELFGHSKGAYTDARMLQKGCIAEAEGGTLFLDEVESMPANAQVKLLRFLQDQEYKPLGESKFIQADVRVIAASNVNLKDENKEVRFRRDLFYRLNVFSLTIPSLRERKADISILANHFMHEYSSRFKLHGKKLSPSALHKLYCYDWPGNIRELENTIQQSIVVTQGSVIDADDIEIPEVPDIEQGDKDSFRKLKSQAIAKFESEYVTKLLVECQGNVCQAAKLAKMDRRNFYRLMRTHNISRNNIVRNSG